MRAMKVKEVAAHLAADPAAVFVDVRTEQEFAAGHPAGAVNVPIAGIDAYGQMTPNPDFVRVIRALAPDPEVTLVFS